LPRLRGLQRIATAFGGAGGGSKPIVSAAGDADGGKSGAASVTERPAASAASKPIIGG